MKCPNCGCADFYESTLTTGFGCTEGGSLVPIILFEGSIKGYICKNCGRVELFSPTGLENCLKRETEEKKRVEFESSKQERIQALKKEIEQLKIITKDENQTVKVVKEAERRLMEAENELANVEGSVFIPGGSDRCYR